MEMPWNRPRPYLSERLIVERRDGLIDGGTLTTPAIPGQDGAREPAHIDRQPPCGACGCRNTARGAHVIDGGSHVAVLCDDVALCARTYRAGMTAARYGAFLRSEGKI